MNGRANSGARNLLKSRPQAVCEEAHALVHPLGSQAKVEVERRIEASLEGAIACAVLVGLQTAAVWRLDVAFQGARRQLAMSQLHSISSALEQYHLNAGAYPTEAQGLRVLADSGLLPDSDLLDPWGRPVGYSLSQANGAARFELVSLGADGVEGGDGSRADIKLSR